MGFSGCDRCGVAENDLDRPPVRRGSALEHLCPECGRAMHRVSLTEALELLRERAEADEWRRRARSEAA